MMNITATFDPNAVDPCGERGAASPDFPIVLIEVIGNGSDSLVVFLQHASVSADLCWLLLGDDLSDVDPTLFDLPVYHLSDGDDLPVNVLSLHPEPVDLVKEIGSWRHASENCKSTIGQSLSRSGRHLFHVLLGADASSETTPLSRAVAELGGAVARQHDRAVDISFPGLPERQVPLAALAPWVINHWAAVVRQVAPVKATDFETHILPGGASVCLVDPDDIIHPLVGEPILAQATQGASGSISDLPVSARILVMETLRSARRKGAIEHLMCLPIDTPLGTVQFVDLVLMPVDPQPAPISAVLVVTSPPRPLAASQPRSDDKVPQTDPAAARNAVLAGQLAASRLHLKVAVERLELSNDRLKKAFDDLQEAHTELEAYAADLRALTEELVRMNQEHRQKIGELEELTADMAGLLDSIDVGVLFVDMDLKVRRCAPVAARMLRLTEAAEGRVLSDVTAGLQDSELVPLVRQTLQHHASSEREVACWGDCRYLMRILPHEAAGGSVTGAVVTLIDVTAYRQAEAGRMHSEERWRRLVDTAPDGILMHEHGVIEMANRSAMRILSMNSVDHLVGRKLMDLIIPEGRPTVERQLARAAQEGIVTEAAVTAVKTADGRRVDVEITTSALSEGDRQAFQTILRDVTERRKAEAEINHLVHHDRLTGLPNRTLLLDRLETAMARAARDGRHGALMLLDLDQFKDVNDTLGHPAGDRLLQIVARRLRATIRSTDTLARLGGDEFAIVQTDLSSNTGASGAATLAQKALDAIAEPITIDDHDLFVTCSLGVTLFPIDATNSDHLIKNADLALYRAKAEGGQRFQFFLEQMNAEVLQKKSLERELRRGIERGELSLVFQPQYAIGGGRPLAAEALVRWNHPQRGSISPKMFIPVAEATGLIRPLGRWVLEEACRAIRRGVEAGNEIGIGVNLSAAQLRHGDFVALLQSTLNETGIRPDLLEIEITESLLFEPSNDAIAEMLRRIASLGVRLAVDDFGTGYSSLAYLKRFPVHKIKIDQSFVRDIGRDKDDDMIVTAMVSLAHSLGKRAIAEGVETDQQLEFLRSVGCDEVQGYVMARPMPEADLTALLAQA